MSSERFEAWGGKRRDALSELSSRPADRWEALLSRRIEKLDTEPPQGSKWPGHLTSVAGRHAAARLGHFADVMCWRADTLDEIAVGPRATISPGEADTLVGRSRLLAEIARFDPSLIIGPMDRNRQHWVPIGRTAYNGESPSEEYFIAPQPDQPAAVKPVRVGLYTSTMSAAGISMWRAFLGAEASMMYPLPWYTWELEIDEDVAVAEIGSATAWVEFVCAHARVSDGQVFPDWVDIARSYDAVHLTLPMIVAAQGLAFDTPHGEIPAEFWDVETTIWLKWRISGARLVEKIDSPPETSGPSV
jgi:hypothetical protein